MSIKIRRFLVQKTIKKKNYIKYLIIQFEKLLKHQNQICKVKDCLGVYFETTLKANKFLCQRH